MQELMDRRVVRLLGGSLQPVEIARAVAQAMEAGFVDSLAPNRFRVLLHPEDCADLRALEGDLERKLSHYAVELARERGWNFAAPPRVHILADASIGRGRIEVEAEAIKTRHSRPKTPDPRPQTQAPELQFEMPTPGGSTFLPLDHLPFTIGRRSGHDLVLPDGRVSRDHAVVEAASGGYRLRDLGSRNGTLLNGEPIAEADLSDGDRLAIGGFEVTVRLTSPL